MRKAVATFAIVAGLTAGCAPPLPRAPEPVGPAPADFPAQRYVASLARGEPVFRVDPARSMVVVEVRRAGSLARLGHDHVVASHDVQGYVAPNDGRADLYVPLDRLVVDEPALRAEAGFDTVPTESDIEGTLHNMLTRVLEVENYPFARIAVSDVNPGTGEGVVNVAIVLHGVTRTTRIPLRIENTADDIVVSGNVMIRQTDFGMTPLSILGGAVQVADDVQLRFRILARRCVAQACQP
jgi:hypothetical protein